MRATLAPPWPLTHEHDCGVLERDKAQITINADYRLCSQGKNVSIETVQRLMVDRHGQR